MLDLFLVEFFISLIYCSFTLEFGSLNCTLFYLFILLGDFFFVVFSSHITYCRSFILLLWYFQLFKSKRIALYIIFASLSTLYQGNAIPSPTLSRNPIESTDMKGGRTCSRPIPSCLHEVNKASICKWNYVLSRDINRIPDILRVAVCECCSPYFIDRSDIKCIPIYVEEQVLRFNGTSYASATETRAVGCTPVLICWTIDYLFLSGEPDFTSGFHTFIRINCNIFVLLLYQCE